ncbi:MAG: helix-turn-helix domain-containing protein [Sphaerochaetaceae bacterium]|jgi:excisionase family DNA binding protein|nr:helix-turn-helix domain-containing protein [Sphaerochaetaceae bacterium]HHU88476.1 helix-turn-helix domain-containing protein [Spirochaetales bacterium]
MDDKWLTVEEIRHYLNVSKETIYRWVEQKSMPGHRVGRRWMFKQNEIDSWIRSGGASEK